MLEADRKALERAGVVVAFLAVAGSVWGIPATLAAPSTSTTFGQEVARTFYPATPSSAWFRWDLNATLRDPDVVKITTYVPFAERPTRDADRGVNATVELVVNGMRVYHQRYEDDVGGDVSWPGWPPKNARIDWSTLRSGVNHLVLFANFTLPPGDHEKTGSVLVTAGPAVFLAEYEDADRDGVADVNQPIPWIPTWLTALAAGAIAAVAAGMIARRFGPRRR